MRQFAVSAIALIGFISSLNAASLPVWIVDKEKSSVSFEYIESGKPKSGAFDAFEASIAFDPDMPDDATATFSVLTSSINLNDSMREGVLLTLPWFHSEEFPRADFSLTDLKPTEGGKFVANGVLRIKTIEMPVELMVSWTVNGKTARAMGALEIDRTDFKLRDAVLESIVGIDERVKIGFDLIATLQR